MKLSNKEIGALELLLQGKSHKEIAAGMQISLRTAKAYLSSAARQLDVPKNWGATHVILAVRAHSIRSFLGIRCQACGEV